MSTRGTIVLAVVVALCPVLCRGAWTPVVFEDFDDGDHHGWTVTDRAGDPAQAPALAASPQGFAMRGLGSGYSPTPGLNVWLSRPLAVSGAAELRVQMRARSGSGWPNSATLALDRGADSYGFTVSGESHQYAQLNSGINHVDLLFPYRYTDVGNWHTYAWTRSAQGWWSLSIDGIDTWRDFHRENAGLSSFDTVLLHTLRSGSEIEWVRVSVPEPATLLLLVAGVLAAARRR